MNKLQSAFAELETMGWFTGWGLSCCSSCAWMDVPDYLPNGEETDLSKVLFNHEQDIEDESVWDDVGENDEDEIVQRYFNMDEQRESLFCFDGSKNGVKNLKQVLPIFEQCGVKVNWNGKGDSRIELQW